MSIPIAARRRDMVSVSGGSYLAGASNGYPEEWPVRRVRTQPFLIDRGPVTNAQFEKFVAATGYVTVAERRPDQQRFPGAVAGSAVFHRTRGPVDLRNPSQWWRYVPGACWYRPRGRGSGLHGLDDHPVVQVTLEDALTYAEWAGVTLPQEAEWERAARGGLQQAPYAWGREMSPGGRQMANIWHGRFPWENTCEDGFEGTSPVGSFPPNGFGLLDAIGNVWEWTCDRFTASQGAVSRCCGPAKSDPAAAYVIKGGSHLCAPNYCRRYRPAARIPQTAESATSHIGFRCAIAISADCCA